MGKSVRDYYENPESRYGYRLFLKNAQHFGYYPNFDDDISEFEAQNLLHDLLIEKLDLETGNLIVDAGCGRGVVSSYIVRKRDVNIIGVDIVPYIIDEADEHKDTLGLGSKLKYNEGDYEKFDLENSSVDRVYTVETLSHAQDLSKTLNEFHRILKHGGISVFIEYEVAPFSNFSEHELSMYKLVRDGSSMSSLDDFVEGNFLKLLELAGFEVLEDIDLTKNMHKSFRRLYKLALFPYQLIKLLGLRKKFINTTAGVEYYKLAEKNLFRYHLYKVQKSS